MNGISLALMVLVVGLALLLWKMPDRTIQLYSKTTTVIAAASEIQEQKYKENNFMPKHWWAWHYEVEIAEQWNEYMFNASWHFAAIYNFVYC